MRIIDNMHVLLLKGGYGSEREVSLKSAEACSKAIKENGLKVTEIDISETNLNDLSMGMSNDYDVACKFGSTFLRIGTKIFGERG